MSRSRLFFAVLAGACAVVGATTAVGASSFPTALTFTGTEKTADPDVLIFNGVVSSPKAACQRNRLVKFATTPAGEDGPFTPQGSDRSASNGAFEEDVDVTGFPDVRITAPKRRFGPRGNRKTCKKAEILLTAD